MARSQMARLQGEQRAGPARGLGPARARAGSHIHTGRAGPLPPNSRAAARPGPLPSLLVKIWFAETPSTQTTKLDLPRMHFSPPGDVRLDHTNFFDMAGDGSYIFDDVTDSTHFSGGAGFGSGC